MYLRVKVDGFRCRSSRFTSLPDLLGGLLDVRLVGRLAGLFGIAFLKKEKELK